MTKPYLSSPPYSWLRAFNLLYSSVRPDLLKTHRNQSLDDFMTVMIALKSELNAIGSNYNHVVKRLHALQHFDEIKTWLLLNESARKILVKKVDEIKLKIHQINDQWLQ